MAFDPLREQENLDEETLEELAQRSAAEYEFLRGELNSHPGYRAVFEDLREMRKAAIAKLVGGDPNDGERNLRLQFEATLVVEYLGSLVRILMEKGTAGDVLIEPDQEPSID